MLTQREIYRQIFHLGVGIGTALLFYFDILTAWIVFLMVMVGLLASILSKRTRLPFFSYFLDKFERDEQRRTFPGKGMIFFFIGVLLVMKLFEKDIALAAVMVLSLGDSVSHVFGAKFGQIKNIFNGKSRKLLEGTIAGALAGGIGAVLFVPFPEAFLGSLGAMIAEVLKIDLNDRTLDDNLVVPLVAGTIMLLLRKYV
ncbi:TPA: hypothetical protein HA242_01150 [Candidatus Woesearchaeota archaeon]|nr:hypothetical protein [Candidatus Woesearchaeota archaeon]